MVTTQNNHSPTSVPSPAPPSAETNNPNFIRKNLPSPWAQVVRGGSGWDTESQSQSPTGIHQSLPSSSSSSSSSLTTVDQPPPSDDSPKAAVVSSSPKAVVVSSPLPAPMEKNSNTIASDGGDGGNAGGSKKPAWNKQPLNGVAVEIGPVMGAESWPALSESAKIPGKLPPESSSSKIAPPAAVDGSPSTSQGPIISHSPQRQGSTSNTKSSSMANNNLPNRPRPMRRISGSNIGPCPAQSSLSNPPTPPPLPPYPVYQLPPAVSYPNMLPSIPDSSPRDHHRNNNWDARPFVGGSSHRGHFGSHPRGDGSYHQNSYSSRREHDRGNYANTRDAHAPQPRMPPRGILRPPPPSTAAFLGPQTIGPFPAPVAYPDFYYFPTVPLDPFRGMPVFPHMPSPATFFPAAESSLSNVIVNQIDYYFSDINLANDEFLKSNMDEEGWVPITLIANFPRVKNLTSNIQLILDSMRNSNVVDVQGDKLRRRNWIDRLTSAQVQADAGSVSPIESRDNSFTADFQTITLDKTTKDEGESSRQSQLSNGSDVAGNIN